MVLKRVNLAFIALIYILASFAGQALAAERAKPYKTVLDNGLTVVIEEERSAPVVSMQMWVKVGSADESKKIAGISHVFEHMLFKGTKTKPVGQIASMVESVGGDINAYTSFDNTVFHLTIPSRHFSTGLDVISDAVQNSSMDPEELKKELEVVLEEIRMNEDNPGRRLFKSILGTAYNVHPYGRPVIGYVDTVSTFTRKEIMDFYRTWYVPNNMVLVIAGDDRAADRILIRPVLPRHRLVDDDDGGLEAEAGDGPTGEAVPDVGAASDVVGQRASRGGGRSGGRQGAGGARRRRRGCGRRGRRRRGGGAGGGRRGRGCGAGVLVGAHFPARPDRA